MKALISKALRKMGYDIVPFKAVHSALFRMQRLLLHNDIDLILDVGANVGQYAKLVRKLGYSGRIVSFEPLSNPYAQLLIAKRDDPLWEIAPRVALGDTDGEIRINIAKNSYISSVLDRLDILAKAEPDSVYVGSEIVQLHRLDSMAAPYINGKTHAIFLKIDVQGFEREVLEGAKNTLSKVKGVLLELSLVPLYRGQVLLREMLDKMDSLGYDLYDIAPVFADETTGRLLQVDGTFFRR
jgi:FkbM family methyltransferase